MAISHLPVLGSPTSASTPLRKIALEEHFVDPAQAHRNVGEPCSGENDRRELCRGNAAALFGLPR
jgi:hypothetical protein